MPVAVCSICGGTQFTETAVLWPELVAAWQLSDAERAYVDRQQGCACSGCGANLRIVALADAIRNLVGTPATLRGMIAGGMLAGTRILDCNGAAGLSAELAALPGYVRIDYPEHDMCRLPFADASFEIVVHSDTLEHVEQPVVALEECRRVLAPNGRLCFTVPIIVGRLSRSRDGLPPSHHGDAATGRDDFIVRTEYGADAWRSVFEAGFTDVTLTQVDYPSAIALTAWVRRTPAPLPAAAAAPPQPVEEVAVEPPAYEQDNLKSYHNHEFMTDPAFCSAYARGVQAAGTDYRWHWRVHTGLWAATCAAKLPGDFVEFGVNRGFLSSAIMQRLDWNGTGRTFYLLDTFAGIDERYINEEDRAVGVIERNRRDIDTGFYTFDLDAVRANFAEWPGARIIAGPVPDTLDRIDSSLFAFAHIDMNCAVPEVHAAEWLWPRLTPGALVLLDDYAYLGYGSQKVAMDRFAAGKGIEILSLPTGQGLMIRPPD